MNIIFYTFKSITNYPIYTIMTHGILINHNFIKCWFIQKGHKDPNAPKRPQTAYFQWLNENREMIKKDNPGIRITEISKEAGRLWKLVSDADKSVSCIHIFIGHVVMFYLSFRNTTTNIWNQRKSMK